MQVAFRVQTDAAILSADCVLAGGADTYPAPPATPCHHSKLTTSFSPQTRNATCGSPHFARRKMNGEFRVPWLVTGRANSPSEPFPCGGALGTARPTYNELLLKLTESDCAGGGSPPTVSALFIPDDGYEF